MPILRCAPGATDAPSFPRLAGLCRALAVCGMLGGAALPAPAVHAQATAAVSRYEIPGGNLADALNRFARTAGVMIAFTPDQVRNLRSAGVSGQHSVPSALATLLEGTGLRARAGAEGYVLEAAPATGGDVELKAVTVSAAAERTAVTEGSGSYTTGATAVATRLDLSVRETPQSVSVITRQRMDDQGLTQLADVVKQTAGLSLNQTGDLGSDSSAIYARGFAVENYQVDGVGSIYSNYSSIFQTNDMAIYDRVEVVRGATGLMNGMGAPGATINLVRKRPTAAFQAAAKLEAGSWDYYRSEVDVSSSLNDAGTMRGRLVAAFQENDSYIERLHERKKVLYGIVEADLSPVTLLTVGFSAQHHDAEGHARSGRPLFYSDGTRVKWSRSTSAAAEWATSERHNVAVFGALEHRFDNDWLLKATLSHAVSDYDEVIGYAAGGTPNKVTGAGMNLWAGRWAGQPTQNSFDVSASGPFTLFGRQHDLVVGVSSVHTEDDTKSYGLWSFSGWLSAIPNIWTWDGSSPAEPVNPATGDFKVVERMNSGYVTARFKPLDPLSIIVGTRVTSWNNTVTRVPYSTGIASKTKRSESDQLTPYAGVVYDFDTHWSAYASYTNIFKPQSNRDANGDFLDPQVGDSYELGVKGAFFDDRLNVAAAVYEVSQDNLAVSIPGVFAPDGNQAYRAVSGTKTRGFELELAGELSRDWEATVAFARNRSEDRNGDLLNTNIPQNTFKLFTTYRIAGIGNGLTVGGGLRWQNRSWSNNMGPAKVRFEQGDYTVVDLMASYPITRKARATLNLYNALDEKYYTSTSSSYYGAPRNLRIGLDVRF